MYGIFHVLLIILLLGQVTEVRSGVVMYYGSHGSSRRRLITVFTNNVTWLEAYEHCLGGYGNLAMPAATGSFLLYTRHELFNLGLLADQPIWIAYLKPKAGNDWYRPDQCAVLGSLYQFDHDSTRAGECAMLDMNKDDNSILRWPSGPCDERHPFVCVEKLQVDIEYTTMYGKKILYAYPGWTEIMENMSFEECLTELETTYDYAALYHRKDTNTCNLHKGYIYDYPIGLAVEDGSADDIVVIKKGEDKVDVLSITEHLTLGSTTNLPCPIETTASSSVLTTTSTPTTFASNKTTTSATTSTTSTTTTEQPSTTSMGDEVTSTPEQFRTTSIAITTEEEESLTKSSDTVTPLIVTTGDFHASSSCMEKERQLQLNDSTCSCSLQLLPAVVTTSASKENVNELLSELQKENTLDKKSTSSYKRSLTSAADDRPSSAAIGITGVLIVASVSFVVVLSDIPILLSSVRGIVIRDKTAI